MLRANSISYSIRQRAKYYHTRQCFGHKRKPSPGLFHPTGCDPRLLQLINSFRDHGHLKAQLDPLCLENHAVAHFNDYPLHTYRTGLEETGCKFELAGMLHAFPHPEGSLQEIVDYLEDMYCGTMTLEISHVSNAAEKDWLVRYYEENRNRQLSEEKKIRLAKHLVRSQEFDTFMAKKFATVKRYGAEGAESMMAFIDEVLDNCKSHSIEEMVIGMPHRGRLNLLVDLLQLPKEMLFHKLTGNAEFVENAPCTGDVISHLVTSVDLEVSQGFNVHINMVPNPSHLEAVNPVILGKVRARQLSLKDGPYSLAPSLPDSLHTKVLSLQIHGDASFSAQGIVTESLGLANLPFFDVGGTLHLIVNNQLGFTTESDHGRSTRYCSDVVKLIGAPVIHVSGDHPEEVARATFIAMGYKKRFQKDIVINMTCYRKWGHNELDNPNLTQPMMYGVIENKTSVPDMYCQELDRKGIASTSSLSTLAEEYSNDLGEHLKRSAQYIPKKNHLLGRWENMEDPPNVPVVWDTGCSIDLLKFVGKQSVNVPHEVIVNERLKKSHIAERIRKLESGVGIDWATAEALAFGSLLYQDFNVRLSGQDVGRGTFSHRHAMFVCQDTDSAYIPLNYISPQQSAFIEVVNSPLSEEAVLGFEYGFSIESPQHLVLWEAQFGDFFNGAQIIVDTFISSGEAKWLLQSGLVMLLPHGYDGAGPDHSSSHVEQFLQKCDSSEALVDGDNVNMHIAHPTTPAQYYHLLRRQMIRNFRKPLIVLSPKVLLRLPAATSNISEMAPGTVFQPTIPDLSVDPKNVQRVIFCSGKHYYALDSYRKENNLTNTAIIRLELLCPFPSGHLYQDLIKYTNATEYIWSQEEPMNKGPWTFVQPRFAKQLGIQLSLVSRKPYAASASGVGMIHQKEVKELLKESFL